MGYSVAEYISAGVLVAGIVLFTLGDVQGFPAFHPLGIILIIASLAVDALTSKYEEKYFFRIPDPISQSELLCYASFCGAVYGFLAMVAQGELMPAVQHSLAHPSVVPQIAIFSVLGYSSVAFVLSLIKYFDATQTEIVKSLRKVLSICISFVLYPKPINNKYIGGFILVVVSIIA